MLRLLVLALLLANAAFLAWSQGWLAPVLQPPHHGEREPERLAAQVRPETVVVLPPAAASAALSAARVAAQVCLEAGPLPTAGLPAAEAALAAAQLAPGAWRAEAAGPAPAQWAVYAGRYADAPARRARREELTRLGLAAELLTEPPELAPGLVVSRHASKEAADAALAEVARSTTLRGARVVELPPPPPPQWLRVPAADPDSAARLRALPGDALAGGFKPCAPR